MKLYVIDYNWYDVSEYGGLIIITARDDNEAFEIVKEIFDWHPSECIAGIRKAIENADKYYAYDFLTPGVVRTFIT